MERLEPAFARAEFRAQFVDVDRAGIGHQQPDVHARSACVAWTSLQPRSSAFGTRPSTEKSLAETTAGRIVDTVNDAQILGEDRVSGIAERQNTQHLDHARFADGRGLKCDRIASR